MYGTEELAYELLGVLNRKYLKIRNILLNLSANIINVLQLGNSVNIELFTRVFLVSTGHYSEKYESLCK